ncbi:protein LTV1 homolog [Clavelina lepadiformis]|uniref:protein LTV1 homolog n=1 Tax=Clavelina lepadiformis TaxID=159417 RepID=UPI00404379DB
MPHRPKRQFIDKKKSVTFQLVHRSQKDPLAADEDAPQRVLFPVDEKHRVSHDISETAEENESRVSMLKTFGIHYEDDYDYLQHLKQPSKGDRAILVPKESMRAQIEITADEESGIAEVIMEDQPVLRLPSEVFGSKVEEEVGMLHRAIPPVGPQPTWDPDIVEGLDEDFDYDNPDNLLEDDFMAQACVPEDYENDNEDGDGYEDYDSDMNGSYFSDEDDFEETRSRFTSYSMTSSVIRRNEQLTLLDDKFEKFYDTYHDTKIGDLCQEEIEGVMPVENVDDMKGLRMLLGIKEESEAELDDTPTDTPIRKKKEVLFADAVISSDSGEMSDDEEVMVPIQKDVYQEKWDCESILSTYSNIYNHPKLIQDPPKKVKVSEYTGIPLNAAPRLTKKQLQQLDSADAPAQKTLPARRKDETKEEKAFRKQAIKATRRERRQEKKATKKAFTQEKTRQNKQLLNVQKNLSGIKIS